MSISYAQAAERAQARMSSVEVLVSCPSCEELITVEVQNGWVEIVDGCVNGCEMESHFDRARLDDDAVSQAACVRESLITHLREADA